MARTPPGRTSEAASTAVALSPTAVALSPTAMSGCSSPGHLRTSRDILPLDIHGVHVAGQWHKWGMLSASPARRCGPLTPRQMVFTSAWFDRGVPWPIKSDQSYRFPTRAESSADRSHVGSQWIGTRSIFVSLSITYSYVSRLSRMLRHSICVMTMITRFQSHVTRSLLHRRAARSGSGNRD
jgi:hypothetical protein